MAGERCHGDDVAFLGLDHARHERLHGPEVGECVDLESFHDFCWKGEIDDENPENS